MRNVIAGIFPILICLLETVTNGEDQSPQTAEKLDVQIRVTFKYLLHLPEGYEKKDSWPLMLFLHGAGENGDDLEMVKTMVLRNSSRRVRHSPLSSSALSVPRDVPGTRNELSALLDEIAAKYKVDQDRIYLTGLSMGGFGTWALAASSPDRFAAIIPICGGGDIEQ